MERMYSLNDFLTDNCHRKYRVKVEDTELLYVCSLKGHYYLDDAEEFWEDVWVIRLFLCYSDLLLSTLKCFSFLQKFDKHSWIF